MLVPLTRKKFEDLVPLVATGDQYRYCWGKPSDLLRRLLISIAGVVVIVILRAIIGQVFNLIIFPIGFFIGFYWLWAPVYFASQRNRDLRRYQYSGFWQGEVLDVYVSEALVGTEETVNKRGELVIVENRERRLSLEIGDDSGFYTKMQVPLKRDHRVIRPGDVAEMIVMSNRSDLGRISQVSDIYLPDYNVWVADYPHLRRDIFVEVSRRLNNRLNDRLNDRPNARPDDHSNDRPRRKQNRKRLP